MEHCRVEWIYTEFELVVNLRRICQGLPESQLDRWRPGDDMKSGILSILWKFMGLKVDHAEAVLRSQNKMRWLKWYTTIFLLL